jgi:Cysteine rich repeat
MMKKIVIVAAAVTLCALGASAQDRPARGACAADIKKFCADVERGEGRIVACIKDHLKDLSPPCQAKFAALAAGSRACVADVKERCKDVRPGRGRVRECLKSAIADLSDACKDAISKAAARRRSL